MPDKNQDEKINSSSVFRQHNLHVDLDKVDLDDLACRYLNKVNSHHGLTEGDFSWLFEVTWSCIDSYFADEYRIIGMHLLDSRGDDFTLEVDVDLEQYASDYDYQEEVITNLVMYTYEYYEANSLVYILKN